MEDARWMQSALALARRRLGQTWPNPAVGCVIVQDGRVLGRGATAPGGRPHAETIALDVAGNCSGATAYVTLEPCAHHGQTPPCTDALIAAGISRVVCAVPDSDPRVAGRGIERLKASGIDVTVGCLAEAARAINAGFFSRIERGRPWVTLKLATTLDGRIATRTGESRWITGPEARRRVHLLRAQSDAVMIGAGTARTDNPMLDVRELGLARSKPVRVVVDSSLSLPLTHKLATTAETQPLWLMHRAEADPARVSAFAGIGANTIATDAHNGVLDIGEALSLLGARGLTRVLVEGGGQLAASLLDAGSVDEIALFTAGKAFGGDGTPAVRGFGLDVLENAPQFDLIRIEAVGADTLSTWRLTETSTTPDPAL
ncbi:MAG: bifunctional diaminohydroxyphosphoribosylaminopyrimidine deaminase/5-amino-6-(5-phosphoribosylamino)uracil reductase RibD [Paracoccaceae bacterium]